MKAAWIAIAALAMLLAVSAPGHSFAFAVGPIYPYPYSYYPYGYYPYGYYPYYGYPVPSYLYYCRSAGAYYPAVESCPDGWVPIPVT